MIYPYSIVNQHGTSFVESFAITFKQNTSVIFTFNNHAFANPSFRGAILVKINQPIPAAATNEPILFESNGITQNVKKYGGNNFLASDFGGTGVYLCFFDKHDNTLQIISAL